MPAIGESGTEYVERDICEPDKYIEMQRDTLWLPDHSAQVFPVRHPTSPHFRRFRSDVYRVRVGRKERSEAHAKCIAFLIRNLKANAFQLSTPTFTDGVRSPDGQVFLKAKKDTYDWWSDSKGTRIPIGNGRYIQPDLCGRRRIPDAFHATLKWPNVIVEVIDTHYPEQETLFELLKLSTQNFVVMLHFIRGPSFSSYYSRLEVDDDRGLVKLRDVLLLIDGEVLMNGTARADKVRLTNSADFALWYTAFEADVLLNVMRTKDRPPTRQAK
jgi:hypothetical protein